MYALTRLTLGNPPKIEIDANRYAALKSAMRIQIVALEIEEKFDLLMRNYEEFEGELIKLTLAHMVRAYPTWSRMSSARHLLVRRLVNLLSTSRLYIDHVKHAVSSSSKDLHCTQVQVEDVFCKQYDKSIGYRVMEALRNYIQHRGVAIKTISYPGQIERNEKGEPLWNFRLDLTLDMESLRRDKRFKRSVLKKIEALPSSQRDPILFVRQYVEGLGYVQEQLRGLIQSAVDSADEAVDEAVGDWKTAGHGPVGLSAVKFRENSTVEECVYILHNTKKRRAELAAENNSFSNLSRRFVSSARKLDAYPAFQRRS